MRITSSFQITNQTSGKTQKVGYSAQGAKIGFSGGLQKDTFERSQTDKPANEEEISVFETFNNGAESTKVIYETRNGEKVPIGYTYKDERVKGKPRTTTMILKENGEFSATYVNPTPCDKYDFIKDTFEKDFGLTVTDNTDNKERKETVYRVKGMLEGENREFVENIIGVYAGTFFALKS